MEKDDLPIDVVQHIHNNYQRHDKEINASTQLLLGVLLFWRELLEKEYLFVRDLGFLAYYVVISDGHVTCSDNFYVRDVAFAASGFLIQ